MYDATTFDGVYWHAKDGSRRVSVSLSVGTEPFSANPRQNGIQFVVRDPADDQKPLALLFVPYEDALKLAGDGVLHYHAGFAHEIDKAIGPVLQRGR